MKIPKIEYEVYYPLNRSNELTIYVLQRLHKKVQI